MCNASVICYLTCLSHLGLSAADLSVLVSWARSRDISLALIVEEKCEFVKESKRDVENPTRNQTEISGFTLITSKQITTVTEFHYVFKAKYELVAYRGVGDKVDDRVVLQSRSCQQGLVLTSKSSPYPEATSQRFDVNISWLLRCLVEESMQVSFSIDRDQSDCHTPARNREVSSALEFFGRFREWATRVHRYFVDSLFRVQTSHSQSHVQVDLSCVNSSGILVPVVPMVESPSGSVGGSSVSGELENSAAAAPNASGVMSLANTGDVSTVAGSTVALSGPVVSQLLAEQAHSLQLKCDTVAALLFPSTASSSAPSGSSSLTSSTSIITAAEAKVLVVVFVYRPARKLVCLIDQLVNW
jgi:hypothetical protein